MQVSSWMNKRPVTIKVTDSLGDAMALLHNYKVRRLPVLDGDDLVGIVTEGDIFRASPGQNVSLFEMHYAAFRIHISDIMKKDPVTIQADERLEKAALLMRNHKISGLPVLRGKKLVGVISGKDILDAFISAMGLEKPNLRFEITIEDQAGVLAHMSQKLKEFGNIDSIIKFDRPDKKASVLLGMVMEEHREQDLIEAVKALESVYDIIRVPDFNALLK